MATEAPAQDLKFQELPQSPASRIAEPLAPRALQPGALQPATGGVERASLQDGDSQPGGLVQAVSFSALETAPSTTYQLVGHSWQEFEQKLVSCWLTRPQAEVVDGGRRVNIVLPTTKAASFMSIDRERGLLEFRGSPAAAKQWQELVSVIDQDRSTGIESNLQIVPLPGVGAEVVTTAAGYLGAQVTRLADRYASTSTTEGAAPQDEPLPGQNPQGQISPGTRVITRTQDAQGQEFTGPVQIQVFPELDAIVILGPPDEVAEVRAMIDQLVVKAKETSPKVARVPLQGANPATTAETVQDVYDQIYAANLGTANVRAIQDPRGLLVIGRDEAIEKIKEIVKEYDIPSEPTDMAPNFRSFKLKFISANDAKSRIDEYFSQATNTNLAEPGTPIPVVTIADFRSNTLIVKGAKTYFDQVEKLLQELDVDSSEAINVVRVFPLRNSLADQVAIVLQDALNGQLQNSGQGYSPQGQNLAQQNQFNQLQGNTGQSSLRSPALQLMTVDRDGNDVRGGIMFDVRVTPNTGNNSLVVAGPKAAMDLVAALVDQLDSLPNAETQIKVFQILNGDAETLLNMLETLFSSQNQQGAQGGVFGGAGGTTSALQLPLQSASAPAGNSLANLRFSFDQRTNSIIASGPVGDLQVVESLLVRLDEQEINNRHTVVIRLSNAPVLDVADSVNAWLDSRQTDITNADPTYISPITQSRRFVIVEPEVVSNMLIVSALPEYLSEVINVIRALDRRPPTLKIKVMIAEVNLSMLEEVGVDLGFQDSLLFDRGIGTIGYPFNQSGIGNNNTAASLATRENLAGQALSNLGTGRINSELNYGGLVLSAGNESINILLRALQDKQCARVLSKPSIMTIENQQGRIQVGATVARIRDVSQTNFGITNGIEDVDIGVILEVTPRVSQDGMIVMYVDAVKSSLGPESAGVPIFVNNSGQVTRSPNINKIEASTTIMARSGQTVVFSGLIQEEKTKFQRGVPVLSNLPLLGPLFRFEGEEATRNELLIILTPYLVDSDEDLEASNTDDMDRMHWCLNDVAEVYGSTNYDPSPVYVSPKVFYPDLDPMGMNPEWNGDSSMSTDPMHGNAQPSPSDMQYPTSSVLGKPGDPRFSSSEGSRDLSGGPSGNSPASLTTTSPSGSQFASTAPALRDSQVKPVSSEPEKSSNSGFKRYLPPLGGNSKAERPAGQNLDKKNTGYLKNPFASENR